MFSDYYADLYSTSHPDVTEIKNFFNKYIPDLRIMDEHALILDEPVTSEEILAVIQSLKTNKSPGLDGLGAEFYKVYGPKLARVHKLSLFADDLVLFVRNPCFITGSRTYYERVPKRFWPQR